MIKGLAFISPNSELSQGVEMALRGHFLQKHLKMVVLAAATWSKRLQSEQIIDTLKSTGEKSWKVMCFGG